MHKFLFSAAVVSTLCIALFHHAAYSHVPLVIVLAMYSYSYSYIHLVNVQADAVVTATNTLDVTLTKRLPVAMHGTVTVTYQHAVNDEATTITHAFSTRAATHTISIPLPLTHCGTLHIQSKVTWTDALSLMRKDISLAATEAVIWPTVHAESLYADTSYIFEQLGTQGGSREQVTAYRPGDNVKHIHWALSAKLQTTVVQQHAFEKTPTQRVAFSFNDVTTLAQYDAFMRHCFSIAHLQSCTSVFIWQNGWHLYETTTPQDVTRLFDDLLRAPLSSLYAPSMPEDAHAICYEGRVVA